MTAQELATKLDGSEYPMRITPQVRGIAIAEELLIVYDIVPFRYVKQFDDGRDPNDIVNLTCLCRTCHGRKTGAENALLRGDVVSFVNEAKKYIPFDRLMAALEFWGVTKRQAKDRLGCVVEGTQV